MPQQAIFRSAEILENPRPPGRKRLNRKRIKTEYAALFLKIMSAPPLAVGMILFLCMYIVLCIHICVNMVLDLNRKELGAWVVLYLTCSVSGGVEGKDVNKESRLGRP